jgi:hypothetical protein
MDRISVTFESQPDCDMKVWLYVPGLEITSGPKIYCVPLQKES